VTGPWFARSRTVHVHWPLNICHLRWYQKRQVWLFAVILSGSAHTVRPKVTRSENMYEVCLWKVSLSLGWGVRRTRHYNRRDFYHLVPWGLFIKGGVLMGYRDPMARFWSTEHQLFCMVHPVVNFHYGIIVLPTLFDHSSTSSLAVYVILQRYQIVLKMFLCSTKSFCMGL
jgi:hypothetical protein